MFYRVNVADVRSDFLPSGQIEDVFRETIAIRPFRRRFAEPSMSTAGRAREQHDDEKTTHDTRPDGHDDYVIDREDGQAIVK